MDRIGRKSPVRWYLREWREFRGFTQEQLAERMDTNKGQVSKLETGAQRLNDVWISRAAHALAVEPGDLLRDPARPTADDLLRGATPEKRRQALVVIEAMMKTGT